MQVGHQPLGRWIRTCAEALAIAAVGSVQPLSAAFEFTGMGARAGGMGDAYSVMARGAEGLFWNPASVVWQEGFSLYAGLDRPFGLSDLNTHSLSGAWCGRRAGMSLGLTRFGPEAYQEQAIAAALSWRPSPRESLGVTVRRLTLRMGNDVDRDWLAFDLGARAAVGRGTEVSLWAWNAGGSGTALVGQGGSAAIGFVPAQRIRVSAEMSKEAGLPVGFGVGLVHSPAEILTIRCGAGGQPERLSLGVGVSKGTWSVDYAAIHHTVLGLSHRVSLRFGSHTSTRDPIGRR